MNLFLECVAFLSLIFLVLSCIEVGSNDAANLVNAVFGAQVLDRKKAVIIAGMFVIVGATFSSPVMNTVRKGIFDIEQLNMEMTLSVFITAYLIGTLLLYVYSIFGMPVSTTATLVFCLAGGALGVLGSPSAINWPKFIEVISAILLSILMSGFCAFLAQRSLRKMIGENSKDSLNIRRHGAWISGFMFMALSWFMVVKGMKHVSFIKDSGLQDSALSSIGYFLVGWIFITFSLETIFRLTRYRVIPYLLPSISILGMACMAFAFGQNDLANCASPGIAILMIWAEGFGNGAQMSAPIWALSLCGVLMFFGMLTRRAQRVTEAGVNTASKHQEVNLYAPNWCKRLALFLLRLTGNQKVETVKSTVGPKQLASSQAEEQHYDALRAAVILSVSACVIAFASGLGLPVSTTYVAFAAVVASGWGDRVFSHGQADLKLGRTIWVVSGWFFGAAIAFLSCALVAMIIFQTEILGLLASIILLLGVKIYYQGRGELHDRIYHQKNATLPQTT